MLYCLLLQKCLFVTCISLPFSCAMLIKDPELKFNLIVSFQKLKVCRQIFGTKVQVFLVNYVVTKIIVWPWTSNIVHQSEWTVNFPQPCLIFAIYNNVYLTHALHPRYCRLNYLTLHRISVIGLTLERSSCYAPSGSLYRGANQQFWMHQPAAENNKQNLGGASYRSFVSQ